MDPVIVIDSLTRDYGHNRGVFDVSFSVQPGEVFGFLGPNGAGKTTTIRHLMGFLKPQQGQCIVAGKECWKDRPDIQQSLGYIPGEMAFPSDMTGQSFLRFYARYRGMKSMGRMAELVKRFELDPKGKLKKMSKGMKQKVGIVAAFMHDPAVLVLDEPTSGLDPLMQNIFIDLVLEEKQRGKTILMSSHLFEEVERTCDRVGIIREGRMAAIDTVAQLKEAQTKRFIVTFGNEIAAKSFASQGLDVEAIDGLRVTVVVRNNIKEFIAAMNRFPVTDIAPTGQSLEEIFLHYYGGDAQ